MSFAENMVENQPQLDHSGAADTERKRLFEIIREHSFRYTPDALIELSSGRMSPLYFNMKATMMDPEGGLLCAHLVFEKVKQIDPDFIGGLEMGAVPIVSTVCAFSAAADHPIPAFFVRKEQKKHGTGSRIEGLKVGATLEGKSVVMVDDVTTTGASVGQAIERARNNGAQISHVVTLVDREEGASEYLAKIGITLIPLYTASDFVSRT